MSDSQPSIERAFLRLDEDGATVFFPWGLTHRGYRLRDEDARRRAVRGASLLVGGTVGIGVWTAHRLQPLLESGSAGVAEVLGTLLAPAGAFAGLLLGYGLWAWRFVEHCPASPLVVSRDERLREAAAFAKPGQVVAIGLVLCGLCGLLFWLQPQAWWLAVAGLVLGIGLVGWGLHLRRFAAVRGP